MCDERVRYPDLQSHWRPCWPIVEDVVVELARIACDKLVGSRVVRVLDVDQIELLAESVRVRVEVAERTVRYRTFRRNSYRKVCATRTP